MKKNQIIQIIFLSIIILFSHLTIFAIDVNTLIKEAANGDVTAQYNLGVCYEKGEGVPQSWEDAVKWYRRAAEQGDARAQCELGVCYEYGNGVPENLDEAAKWYHEAANKGYARAQHRLGMCYAKSYGVPRNWKEAVKWYRKAAEQGYSDAQISLGWCYEEGLVVPQSWEEAVKWYLKAAENGNTDGLSSIGRGYEYGKGVPQSWEEATKWYRKAAERGNAGAQWRLGRCYEKGSGVPQSWEDAIKWYRKAAELGSADAQYNLGVCYAKGEGVPQSWEEAVKWYRKAAEHGYARAQCELGVCYEYGKGVLQSWMEATTWYSKAAEQGYYNAKVNLKNIQNLKLNQFQKRLLTWEQYYDNNKKIMPKFKNEEELKKAIEFEIQNWQEKGEFESTQAWKERVNDNTRNDFIRNTTNNYVAQYNRDIANIRSEQEKLAKEYEAYQKEELNSFYELKISQSLTNFNPSDFELMPYDADHETFLIHSDNFGDILLPVPVSEAPSFKQNWNTIQNSITPEFVPNGEDVALSKLIFRNNSSEYTYDSHTLAQYAISDINYNFAPIELTDIDIDSIQIDGTPGILGDLSSSVVVKTSSEVLTANSVKIDRVTISASEKSDVDTAIPQNRPDNLTNTFAVLIANEDYHSVSKVPFAGKDGEVLEKYLTQAVGLPKDHVKIFKNASFGNIAAALKHIENLSEAFGKDLNLIFYYAGHGMPNEKTKNPMLVPVDGDAAIPETCYELDKVISTLGNLNASAVVVMLDACFSGTERGDGMLMAARGIRIKSNQSEPTGNMVILSASQGDETAYPFDSEQHGLFTYFLLKKLQEKNGDVTLGELADYVTEQVKRQSVISNGKLQTPTVSVSPTFQSAWRNLKLK